MRSRVDTTARAHRCSGVDPGCERRDLAGARLASEVGRIDKQAPFRIALTYPSPYRAGSGQAKQGRSRK